MNEKMRVGTRKPLICRKEDNVRYRFDRTNVVNCQSKGQRPEKIVESKALDKGATGTTELKIYLGRSRARQLTAEISQILRCGVVHGPDEGDCGWGRCLRSWRAHCVRSLWFLTSEISGGPPAQPLRGTAPRGPS